ncbi:hypothetical protein CN327_26665 [Bacillus cereus]|nr:hypothetical protein CN327_26665 [Bacillus cereus]
MNSCEETFYRNIEIYLELINNFLSKQYVSEPLKNKIKIVGGFAFKSALYKEVGIPIIRISDFNNEKVILDNTKKYTENLDLERYELKEGDIIIAMTGGTIGKLAIVQPGLGKIYLNQRVGKFEIIDKKDLIPEYIYWIAKGVQSRINKIGYGGAQPNVSSKQLEAIEFAFPPKAIQQKIIEFITDLKNNCISNKEYFNNDVENKIIQIHEKTLKLLSVEDNIVREGQLLTRLKSLILQEAIQGKLVQQDENDEPSSVLLGKIQIEKEQLKKEKPLLQITDEEKPFELPKGWEWCRLLNIIIESPRNGYSPKAVNYPTSTKNLTLTATTSGYFKEEHFKYIDEEIPIDSYLWLKTGDILIQRSNSLEKVGTACIYDSADSAFIYPDLMMKIRVFNSINIRYVYYVLSSRYTKEYFQRNASGTSSTMPKINQGIVSSTLIPLPPLNEQKRIVEKLEQLMAVCDKLEQTVEQSKQEVERLMKAVLQEAFTIKEEVLN